MADMRGARAGLSTVALRRWDVRAWDQTASEFRKRYYEVAVVAARERVDRRWPLIEQFFRGTESPLEEILGQYLLLNIFNPIEINRRVLGAYLTHEEVQEQHLSRTIFATGSGSLSLSICAQMVWMPYRADFCIVATHVGTPREYRLLVIECDGHATHAVDEQQIEYDARRDKWMKEHGAAVMRFTHADIFNDPCECANLVATTLGVPMGLAKSLRQAFMLKPNKTPDALL